MVDTGWNIHNCAEAMVSPSAIAKIKKDAAQELRALSDCKQC